MLFGLDGKSERGPSGADGSMGDLGPGQVERTAPAHQGMFQGMYVDVQISRTGARDIDNPGAT
jgi:hypothetical protein